MSCSPDPGVCERSTSLKLCAETLEADLGDLLEPPSDSVVCLDTGVRERRFPRMMFSEDTPLTTAWVLIRPFRFFAAAGRVPSLALAIPLSLLEDFAELTERGAEVFLDTGTREFLGSFFELWEPDDTRATAV